MGSFDRMWIQWIQFDRTILPNTAQQGEEHVLSNFSQPPGQSEGNQHLKLGLCSCPPELQIQDHVVGPLVFSTWLGRGTSKTIAEEHIKSFETLIVCLTKPKLAESTRLRVKWMLPEIMQWKSLFEVMIHMHAKEKSRLTYRLHWAISRCSFALFCI